MSEPDGRAHLHLVDPDKPDDLDGTGGLPTPQIAQAYLRDLRRRLRCGDVTPQEHPTAIAACVALVGPIPPLRPWDEEYTHAVRRATAEAGQWFETVRAGFALILDRENEARRHTDRRCQIDQHIDQQGDEHR